MRQPGEMMTCGGDSAVSMVCVGSAAAGGAGLGDQGRGDAQLVVEAVAAHQILAIDDQRRGTRDPVRWANARAASTFFCTASPRRACR